MLSERRQSALKIDEEDIYHWMLLGQWILTCTMANHYACGVVMLLALVMNTSVSCGLRSASFAV